MIKDCSHTATGVIMKRIKLSIRARDYSVLNKDQTNNHMWHSFIPFLNNILKHYFRFWSSKTTTRAYNLHSGSARASRGALRKDQISRYFHARRNGTQNWPSRIASPGLVQKPTSQVPTAKQVSKEQHFKCNRRKGN